MLLNNIIDARLGNKYVTRIMLGDKLIWSREGYYLIITPEHIWLTNDNSIDVDVISNTDWKVN